MRLFAVCSPFVFVFLAVGLPLVSLLLTQEYQNGIIIISQFGIYRGADGMADYQRMYVLMFRASELAARFMEQGDIENALLTLRIAQLQCENIYLETTE